MGKKPARHGEQACSYKHPAFLGCGVRPEGGCRGQGAREQDLFQVVSDSEVQGMWHEVQVGSFTPSWGSLEPSAADCIHSAAAHADASRGLGDLCVGGGRDPSDTRSGHSRRGFQKALLRQDFPEATGEGAPR